MADILKLFLTVSVMASVMIGIILVIRRVFSNKMSPVVMLLLWGMVLIRLVLPFTISSPLQLSGLFPQQTNSSDTNNRSIPPEYQISGVDYAANNNSNLTDAKNQLSMGTTQTSSEAVPAEPDGVTLADLLKNIPWWSILTAVWITGIAATLLFSVRKAILFKRKLKFCNPVANESILEIIQVHKKETGVKKAIAVLECDFVHAPAVFGYFKPYILMPSQFINNMNRDSLKAILLHEIYHIRCHDILTNYIWLAAKALHWFNPFVWFACRTFEEDVELRRDQKAAHMLEADGIFVYSKSLLEAARFSRQGASIPSAAAALFENKCKLRQRIFRLIKPHKKTKSAAVVSAMLAILMIFGCFTTACQPTPEEPPVVNKGDNRIEEIIASSASSPGQGGPSLAEAVGAREMLKDSYTNEKGDVTVTIDAKVETPSVEALPVVPVKIPEFTQEQADKFGAYFLKGAPLYSEEGGWTKEEILEMIVNEKQAAEALKNGGNEEAAEECQDAVRKLEEQYKTAPVERKILPATLQFISDENGTRLHVLADLGKDGKASFGVSNSDACNVIEFYNDGKGHYSEVPENQTEAPRGMVTTREDAEKAATQCLSDLGIEGVQIESVKTALYYSGDTDYYSKEYQASAKQCYVFSFSRMIHGIPIKHIEGSTGLSTDDPNVTVPEEPDFSLVSDPEKLKILVDDTGIVGFQWTNPTQELEVLSEQVTLLPFEDVVQRAKDNIFYKNYTAYGSTSEIKITSIRLGMMRIVRKDKPGEYLIVPVWDFIGNSTSGLAGHEDWLPFGDQSFVTINAIDGSMIHREWGY